MWTLLNGWILWCLIDGNNISVLMLDSLFFSFHFHLPSPAPLMSLHHLCLCFFTRLKPSVSFSSECVSEGITSRIKLRWKTDTMSKSAASRRACFSTDAAEALVHGLSWEALALIWSLIWRDSSANRASLKLINLTWLVLIRDGHNAAFPSEAANKHEAARLAETSEETQSGGDRWDAGSPRRTPDARSTHTTASCQQPPLYN